MKYCAAQLQLCFDMRCRMEFFGEEKKKKKEALFPHGVLARVAVVHIFTPLLGVLKLRQNYLHLERRINTCALHWWKRSSTFCSSRAHPGCARSTLINKNNEKMPRKPCFHGDVAPRCIRCTFHTEKNKINIPTFFFFDTQSFEEHPENPDQRIGKNKPHGEGSRENHLLGGIL